MKDRETKVTTVPEKAKHTPRPVKPEDESYGELMMRFTAHPVKPKYWFEEFGDHWTCSCGQINKGEVCSNCGLERDLLRKLFILHKPGPDGQPAKPSTDGEQPARFSTEKDTAATAANQPADLAEDNGEAEEPGSGKSHRSLLIGVIIVAVLLLLGTGAFLYFVVIPEMQEQDAARQDSVRITLTENLPIATAPLPKAQFKAYVAAGDALCKKEKFVKAQNYYNRAADLKNNKKIKKKILDAKYGYVKLHQNDGGEYFETYLNELVDAKYDGARAIYYQYYAWHVNIVANNISDDFSTDMKNVNRNDTVYFHTTVTGGPPDDAVRLYYEVTWPNGSSEKEDVSSAWHAGSHFSTRFQYAMPAHAKAGKLTFRIYDRDSRELLGSDSIMLKK